MQFFSSCQDAHQECNAPSIVVGKTNFIIRFKKKKKKVRNQKNSKSPPAANLGLIMKGWGFLTALNHRECLLSVPGTPGKRWNHNGSSQQEG